MENITSASVIISVIAIVGISALLIRKILEYWFLKGEKKSRVKKKTKQIKLTEKKKPKKRIEPPKFNFPK